MGDREVEVNNEVNSGKDKEDASNPTNGISVAASEVSLRGDVAADAAETADTELEFGSSSTEERGSSWFRGGGHKPTAEPTLSERKKIGLRVMIFLFVLAGLLYFTKKRVWRNLH